MHQPVEQAGIDEMGVQTGDEEDARAFHVDAVGRGRGQRAMAQLQKFRTACIAGARVFKHFFRFEIKEAHAHRAAAKNSFEMAFAAAAAETLFRVQCDHGVPPSHTPSLAGYRPKPMPLPSVHTRVSWCNLPCVAAMPAAMASASLKTRTGTPAALPLSEAESAACSANPFTCCKLGDSSTTPLRIIPGKPTPMASIFCAPATFSTSSRMAPTTSSECMDCKGSSDCGDSGKSLSWPVTWLPSTRPAAICSITKTPTVLLIARLPISCQTNLLKSSYYFFLGFPSLCMQDGHDMSCPPESLLETMKRPLPPCRHQPLVSLLSPLNAAAL